MNYFTHFDEIFNMFDNLGHTRVNELIPTERKASICTMPNYPHSNVFLSEDTNTLDMEFALAGYSKDEVSVTADDGLINVNVAPLGEPEGVAIHKGISRRKVNFSIRIDKAFDARKAETSFVDGLLRLRMTKAEECQSTKLM